jgi:hypothetical protein
MALRHENAQLQTLVGRAGIQLERDFAQMKLMDRENERLQKRAFQKEANTGRKHGLTTAHA